MPVPPVAELLGRSCRRLEPLDITDLPPADRHDVSEIHAALIGPGGGTEALLFGGYRRAPLALAARFCLTGSQPASDLLAQHRPPDGRTLLVELVHWPGNREGNILLRPLLAHDVVAFAGGGGGTLCLDRLVLRVDRDELRVRDLRTGLDVELVLHAPHDPRTPGLDPLYAFLGRLAWKPPLRWRWTPFGRWRHLPRVTSGSVVVAPECQHEHLFGSAQDDPSVVQPGRRFA